MISTFETLRLFKKFDINQSLSDLIFMIDFLFGGEPYILNKDGSVMVVFEIDGIEYESLEPAEIDEIEKEIRLFSELIKEPVTISNYYIRKRGERLELKCDRSAPPLVCFLQEKKEQFYNSLENETFQSTILCTIKLDNPLIKKKSFNYFARPEQEYVLLKRKIMENYEKLKTIYNLSKTSLQSIGIRELTNKEIFSHFFYIINGKKEVPPYRCDLSLNAQLARSSYTFLKDHFKVDDGLRRVVALLDEPPSTWQMAWHSLLNHRGEIIIKNSFFTLDYEKLKRNLKSNYKISKALLFKKILSDEYVTEYEENEYKVEKERRKPFYHHMSILVSADSIEQLRKSSDELVAKIGKTGAYAAVEKGYLPPAAISFFPGQSHFNKRKKYILSDNLSNLFIKGRLSRGDDEPLEYFLDRSGNFYGLNPFGRNDAPHMIISGATGKGKSYLLIKILLSFLAVDSRIIALDRSLAYFFEILKEIAPQDTSIMRLEAENIGLCFNPFLVEKEGGGVTEEQMGLCEGLLAIIFEKQVDSSNRYLIRRSLEQFFEEYLEALRHSNGVLKPLDLLITIIKDKFRNKEVENALRLWMKGDRAEILNSGVDNLQNRKYTLFDLKGIEDREDILRVVSYLLFQRIEKVVTDETLVSIPKILAIDEAKYYYDKRELAPLLDRYIRQGRKHNLCVILNFQSINDAIKTDDSGNLVGWSKGLFENIQDFILFGRQLKIEHALDALKLNEYQKELYDSLEAVRREFLLVSKGGATRVLTPVTGPFTNVIATSHPKEREYRECLRKECGGGYIETVERFVRLTEGSLDLEERLKRLENHFKGVRK